jgi:hypothetical protein
LTDTICALYQIGILIMILCFNKTYEKIREQNQYDAILAIISITIFYNVLFLIFFVGKLFIRYLFLTMNNLTFYDNFKDKWKKFPWKNPFN